MSVPNNNDVAYIYQQYLKAFKKGVYNYIKEESVGGSVSSGVIARSPQGDAAIFERTIIPRKYFSGGVVGSVDPAMTYEEHISPTQVSALDSAQLVDVKCDFAMINHPPVLSADGAMNRRILDLLRISVKRVPASLVTIKRKTAIIKAIDEGHFQSNDEKGFILKVGNQNLKLGDEDLGYHFMGPLEHLRDHGYFLYSNNGIAQELTRQEAMRVARLSPNIRLHYLYFENRPLAPQRMVNKNKRLIKTGITKILLKTG